MEGNENYKEIGKTVFIRKSLEEVLIHLPWFVAVSRPQLHFVQVFQVAAVRTSSCQQHVNMFLLVRQSECV